jgi:hypothetical protein
VTETGFLLVLLIAASTVVAMLWPKGGHKQLKADGVLTELGYTPGKPLRDPDGRACSFSTTRLQTRVTFACAVPGPLTVAPPPPELQGLPKADKWLVRDGTDELAAQVLGEGWQPRLVQTGATLCGVHEGVLRLVWDHRADLKQLGGLLENGRLVRDELELRRNDALVRGGLERTADELWGSWKGVEVAVLALPHGYQIEAAHPAELHALHKDRTDAVSTTGNPIADRLIWVEGADRERVLAHSKALESLLALVHGRANSELTPKHLFVTATDADVVATLDEVAALVTALDGALA